MLIPQLINVFILILSDVLGNYHHTEPIIGKKVPLTFPKRQEQSSLRKWSLWGPNVKLFSGPLGKSKAETDSLEYHQLEPSNGKDFGSVLFSKLQLPGIRPPWQDQKQTTISPEFNWRETTTSAGTITESNEESTSTERPTYPEEPTTTQESTTEETEEPSTTDMPATCNTSLYSKEDLEQIFDYIAEKLQVISIVVGSFNTTVIPDKHLRDITLFRQWFQDRPFHLQHVLEDIRQMSKELEPVISKVYGLVSTQTPMLVEQYKEKYYRYSKILHKLKKQIKICELTCQNEDLVERIKAKENQMQNNDTSYCGSIAYIHSEVTAKITSFIENMQNVYQNRLFNDDINYESEIQEVKTKLKNKALHKFGRTMYDILNLQDTYRLLWQKIEQIDEEMIINNIRKNMAQIDVKLLTLESSTADLARYCRSCNMYASRNLIEPHQINQESQEESDDHGQVSSEVVKLDSDMLDSLIITKLQQIVGDVDSYYREIFEPLENSLNEADATTSYIEDLKLIQAEINKATKEEYDKLNYLKEHTSAIDINTLVEIETHTKQMLESIDAYIVNTDVYIYGF